MDISDEESRVEKRANKPRSSKETAQALAMETELEYESKEETGAAPASTGRRR